MGPYQMIMSLAALSAGASLETEADFKAAQELYAQRATLANHERAADAFAAVARRLPESLEAQLWCARTAYYVAHRLRDEKPRMRRTAEQGLECGERLLRTFGSSYDAQLWGLLARFRKASATSWIPPLGEIEKLTRQLETLRAKFPGEFATYMLLGAMYRELPGWPLSIGDRTKSMAILTEGQKLAPDNAELLLQVADTYRALGDKANAKLTYRRCVEQGTGPAELTWESADAQAWAKKMLTELE
jgi:hypothetical protein